MTATSPTTTGPAPAESLPDLHILIALEHATITDLEPLLRVLIDTHQAGLGFLTVEAAKVQDDLIRQERWDRYVHARDGVTLTGAVPAPGSITAFSLLAEWHRLSGDVDNVPSETRSVRYLEALHRDLVDLKGRIDKHIEGTQIKALPDPCPWCGLPTLVADLVAGVITCARDPHTGHHQPCNCSDSYCPCQTTHHHRHTWHRDHKAHKTTSWQGLRRAINAQEPPDGR